MLHRKTKNFDTVVWKALRRDMGIHKNVVPLNILPTRKHDTVHDTLGYRKVSACWAPQQLSKHKEMHMDLCLEHVA